MLLVTLTFQGLGLHKDPSSPSVPHIALKLTGEATQPAILSRGEQPQSKP